MPTPDARAVADRDARLDAELAGLDALELAGQGERPALQRFWSAAWPKLLALAIVLAVWQGVVWSGWKSKLLVPPPADVWTSLREQVSSGMLWESLRTTGRRAAVGFSMSLGIGIVIGAVVSQVRILRAAIGSLITGLQTMPSIAWFPFAVLLFKRSEAAILFVVVLGAAPSIANGLISGVDNVPPLLVRAGRTMGAKGTTLFRYVILPGALPSFVGGLKQGWAFAWRSLMAGELLVIVAGHRSIGERLDFNRQLFDSPAVFAYMIVILVIGIAVDALFFGTMERAIQRRWGLTDPSR